MVPIKLSYCQNTMKSAKVGKDDTVAGILSPIHSTSFK